MSVKERLRAIMPSLRGRSDNQRRASPVRARHFADFSGNFPKCTIDRRTARLRSGQVRRRPHFHEIWSIFQGSRAK